MLSKDLPPLSPPFFVTAQVFVPLLFLSLICFNINNKCTFTQLFCCGCLVGLKVDEMLQRDLQKIANDMGIKHSAVPPKKTGTKETDGANTLSIRSTPDGKHITLGVPLPGGEVLIVPLKLHETVRDLIDDIRQEDGSIESLVLRYADNLDYRCASRLLFDSEAHLSFN